MLALVLAPLVAANPAVAAPVAAARAAHAAPVAAAPIAHAAVSRVAAEPPSPPADADPPTGTGIWGRVTGSDAPTKGVANASVFLCAPGICYSDSADADGNFDTAVPSGTYTVTLGGPSGSLYLNSTVANTVVVDGQYTRTDSELVLGATFSGTITSAASGAGVDNVFIDIQNASGGYVMGYTDGEGSGHYTSPVLAPGSYTVDFSTNDGSYITEWRKDAGSKSTATPITLAAGDRLTDISPEISSTLTLSGTVVGDDAPTVGLAPTELWLYLADNLKGVYDADQNGHFEITGLKPGKYKIWAVTREGNAYQNEWYQNKTSQSDATVIDLQADTDITMSLARGAQISGRVTDANNPTVGIEGQNVFAWTTGDGSGFATTDADGYYTISNLEPGSYKLQIQFGSGPTKELWWDKKLNQSAATAVVLTAGQSVSGKDFLLGTPLTQTRTPMISGTKTVGSVLTATSQAWSPAPVTLAYQWNRNGVAISGATGNTYTAVADDVLASITVTATGTKSGYSPATATSSAAVIQGTLTTATPTISGAAEFGQVLTASAGTWGPSPVKLTYQWNRNGTSIGSSARQSSYTLTATDIGKTITVTVTGTKTNYTTASATSAAVTATAAGLSTTKPVITGNPVVGQQLTATVAPWGPSAVTLTGAWTRNGTPIAGQTGATYTLSNDDAGSVIAYSVTGTKTNYATTMVSSEPTATVTGGTLSTTVPTISGTPKVGETLTGSVDAWAPAPVNLTAIWTRDGTPITGQTGATYTLTNDDAGSVIAYSVTGTAPNYNEATVSSLPTATITGGVLSVHSPSIEGTLAMGETLTPSVEPWGPGSVEMNYAWYRETTDGNFSLVSDGYASSYTLGADDVGHRIILVAWGSKPNFDTRQVIGAPTAVIAAGALVTAAPVVTGQATVGSVLLASTNWTPTPIDMTYAWFRVVDGTPVAIPNASSASYTLINDDAGFTVLVKASGSKAGFAAAERSSEPTAKVTGGILNGQQPTISGTPLVGETLTTSIGMWGPSPVTVSWTWNRDGAAIEGATGLEYTLTNDDVGHRITVAVSATKPSFIGQYPVSEATDRITGGSLTAPVPTVAGSPVVGKTLTASPGDWAPSPVDLAYAWSRDGVAITGAEASDYTLVNDDAGHRISVTVTGTKSDYLTQSPSSTPTDVVTGGTLSTPPATITGSPIVGERLAADTTGWGPAPLELGYQWTRDGIAIEGATESGYTLTNDDAGTVIAVEVSAEKTGFDAAKQTSSATAMITGGTLTAGVPTVKGTAQVGSTLTAEPGEWSPAPVELSYQWFRDGVAAQPLPTRRAAASLAAVGTAIEGATSASYTLVDADRGHTISVTVTATRPGFDSLSASSELTTAVVAAPVPPITPTDPTGPKEPTTPGATAPAATTAPAAGSGPLSSTGFEVGGLLGLAALLALAGAGLVGYRHRSRAGRAE